MAMATTTFEISARKRFLFSRSLKRLMLYVFLLCVSVVMLMPFFWLLLSSFKPLEGIFEFPPRIINTHYTINNYIELFTEREYGSALLNSIYIAVVYTTGALFFCALAGFGFAKYEFKYKNILFLILLGSMMIPSEVTMLPTFILFRSLGWIDKHLGLIIPGLANAFGIFFMRQYIQSIDTEFLESARIDGCTEFRIFWNIILPMLKPAFATLGIIFFMGSWNSYLWPMLLLKSQSKYTLTIAIRSLDSGVQTKYNLIMAGAVVSIVPLLIMFFLFQKQFIQGITAGAIKQ